MIFAVSLRQNGAQSPTWPRLRCKNTSCKPIPWLAGSPRAAFKFKKRAEFFVGVHNEALSVIAVRIRNEDCLSVGINRCDAAPTPTGAAEIVSHNFPVM
jgi:hypothetical protein